MQGVRHAPEGSADAGTVVRHGLKTQNQQGPSALEALAERRWLGTRARVRPMLGRARFLAGLLRSYLQIAQARPPPQELLGEQGRIRIEPPVAGAGDSKEDPGVAEFEQPAQALLELDAHCGLDSGFAREACVDQGSTHRLTAAEVESSPTARWFEVKALHPSQHRAEGRNRQRGMYLGNSAFEQMHAMNPPSRRAAVFYQLQRSRDASPTQLPQNIAESRLL